MRRSVIWTVSARQSGLCQEGVDSQLPLLLLLPAQVPSPLEFVVNLAKHPTRGGNRDAWLRQPEFEHRLVGVGIPQRRIGFATEAMLGVIGDQGHRARKHE